MARRWVIEEARSLVSRLARLQPLVSLETMIPAAALHPTAQAGIERALLGDRQRLRSRLLLFLHWAEQTDAAARSDTELQKALVLLRLRFNDLLSNYDLFADALSQRSERDTGLWLSGLDVVASDALSLRGNRKFPAVVCYLDRGPGAAIRRARTRLPGGGPNPVALVRLPRERMVGSSVATSLAHEVGHQAAALLGFVTFLRGRAALARDRVTWDWWQRWVSEILADLWAIAKLGPTATQGLIGVLSLPSAFVFRFSPSDPHPPPWLRVKLSCALGRMLYPDPQWDAFDALWDALYPARSAPASIRAPLAELTRAIPSFARWLLAEQPPALAGDCLGEVLRSRDRSPAALRSSCSPPGFELALAHESSPCRALAVLGQARWLRRISAERESDVLAALLRSWAVARALGGERAARFEFDHSTHHNQSQEHLHA